jgi:hypothetical protein
MAHFAEIDKNNIVLRVVVIDSNDVLSNGGDYSVQAEYKVASIVPLSANGVRWVQTSYNTRANQHFDSTTNQLSADQTKAKRKNYAGIGYTYNATIDGFTSPQPYGSWILDTDKGVYNAPVAYPTVTTYGDNAPYMIIWDEANKQWTAQDSTKNIYNWVPSSSSWVATGKVAS